MRTVPFLLALLLLTSCGVDSGQEASRARPPERAPARPADATAAEEPDPQPVGVEEESSRPAPLEASDWFFVGRWASDVENCRDKAWVISAEGLRTPGHVACTFEKLEPTARGAAAHATCTAEGPPQQWTLQFSYAQSARALLIEDGPFADVGLVECAAP